MINTRTFAVELALKAGAIIKKNHQMGMKREWKSDDTPLTITDKKINQIVLDEIEKAYPEHSIIGEEGSILKESEYAWVCDPVDGTVPFSHGWPTSVFALALTKKGEVILGIIYDPFMDRMAVAEKGKGTYINETRMSVSSTRDFRNNVVDIEAWVGKYSNLNKLHEILTSLYCHTAILRSTSYAALLVACGEIGAVAGSSPNEWDGAAAKIVIEEAGGKVTDLYGDDQAYDKTIKGILASNNLLHEDLLKLITPLINK